MQFVCDQDTLATWLKKAALFADSKSPIPIYGYTKFDVVPGKLQLSAANATFLFQAEIALTDIIPADPGAVCVQADRISDLVTALRPDCPVELSLENRLHLRSGRTRAVLDTLPADEFPAFDHSFKSPQIATHTAELDRILERTLPAMYEDQDRPMLWGLSLQYEGADDGVSAAGCDGTLISTCVLHCDKVSEFPAAILPRPVCLKLRSLLKGSTGPLHLSVNPNAIKITADRWTITSKLIDAVFPLHHLLIAPPVADPITLDSGEFLAILNRIDAAADLDSKVLKQRGAVAAFANNLMSIRDGRNTINDQMDASYGDTSPPEGLGFNTAHMKEAITAIDAAQVELHFIDRDTRIRVCAAGDTEESFTTMPYRIN